MADDRKPSARPTGKRQLTGVSTTSSESYSSKRAVATKDEDEKPGGGPMHFVPEVVEEMKKVIWPTSKQMVNYTLIVFGFLIVMTLLVWGIDILASRGVDLVLNP
ncbi:MULTISPECIES: preprotein translocase subunit SecE [Corynebacterium]|uniref:preprotein translocase subunit SecE n=1 Tax=Corynebacterium TaxID=1716 RepID=UPI00124DA98A|nr:MULTISPECIES: preprotein translocase subunit SecE [Corynebacterium]MBV7282142.1 preprotein translocase subunit SecE [Corynebacterium sp. TAE3-ERU30]MBV7302516.1 preprotein translocase subunit SecE [Corynebacterium sp. TAE3-ERU2]